MFKGQKLLMTEQSTFEMLHKNLDELHGTTMSKPQLNTIVSLQSEVKVSTVSNEPVSDLNTVQLNRMVWQPWWSQQLELSEKFVAFTKEGNFEEVAKMINVQYAQDHAVNVNYQDSEGMSALHYAVQAQNTQLVRLLLSNFADVRC